MSFTKNDRCDAEASGAAQALVSLRLPGGGGLQLCGHHYRKNEVSLAVAGAEITADTRTWRGN